MASLSQLPSGHWRVTAKHKGRRRTGTRPTKAEARLLGAELEMELGARKKVDHVAVGDLLDAHLAAVTWSPTTRLDGLAVAAALPDVFRNRPVGEVDAPIIAGLYRELTRAGWSAHRLQRVRMVLSTAWSTAISYRWATHNPVRDVRPPKLPHRDIRPPDIETVARILDAASGQLEVFLRLAAASGARRGELVALRWSDIDLDARRCRISRSLVWTPEGRAERDTKTSVKGHRTITLGELLAGRLAAHRDWQAPQALDHPDGGVWVFSHDGGITPWRPTYVSRAFHDLCAGIDVHGIRLHDLRHHVATTLLEEGVPVHRVSGRLGHSSTATTQRIYGHWIRDDSDIADRLDDRYG